MKKILKALIIIIIWITFILTILYNFSDSIFLKINWDIYLPKPSENNIIYRFDYREGDDLEIWEYNNSKVEKIKKNDKFTVITDVNITDVKDYMNTYYDELGNDEKKSKFNNNIDINKIVVQGNYYSLIKENDNYLLLLLDITDNKMYYLNHIR